MLAEVIQGLEHCPEDFLGEIYMEVTGSSKESGQFFTPYCICEALVRMLCGDFSDIDKRIQQKGYINICEPACGAGIMIIAFRNLLKFKGYGMNDAFFVATDCDRICCAMTYIQLSLLGIPAMVNHGNSLSMETWNILYTVPYFFSNFLKIHQMKKMIDVMRTSFIESEQKAKAEPKVEISLKNAQQLNLFDF